LEVDVAPEERRREAEWITSLCAETTNPLRGAVIGAPIVDGSLKEFEEWVKEWAGNPYVKGVRQVLHVHPRGTALRDDVVSKAQRCGEHGLVFELCMRCNELEDAAILAAKAPGTRFVLDHIGGHHQLASAQDQRDVWRTGLMALAGCRNVWVKLSGLMGAQGGNKNEGSGASDWQSAQAESVAFCLDAFPRDRILFGGDWPVSKLTAPLNEWVTFAKKCLEGLTDDECDLILRRNAEDAYK